MHHPGPDVVTIRAAFEDNAAVVKVIDRRQLQIARWIFLLNAPTDYLLYLLSDLHLSVQAPEPP